MEIIEEYFRKYVIIIKNKKGLLCIYCVLYREYVGIIPDGLRVIEKKQDSSFISFLQTLGVNHLTCCAVEK